MWNCSELEESPRSLWKASRWFTIHIWSVIKSKQDFIHCIIRIYYQTIYDCKWTWFNLYFHALSIAAFGFCEYKEPESTLRSLRLLHDLQIGDKSLLVKVDAKTKAQLDEWKAKKKTANGVYFLYMSLISVSGFVQEFNHVPSPVWELQTMHFRSVNWVK